MGKMEFSSETSEVSHTIALHANLVLLSSRVFFSGTPARSAGPSVKLFWYVKTIVNAKGPRILTVFSRAKKLSYTRGVIVLHGLTVYILGVFGSTRGSFQNCADRKKKGGPGTCAVNNACATENSASLTSWNPHFTWIGSSQFYEISKLFWHGIWSALEYGQEFVRHMIIYRAVKYKLKMAKW